MTVEDAELPCIQKTEASLYLLYDPKRARLGRARAPVDFLVDALGDPKPAEVKR